MKSLDQARQRWLITTKLFAKGGTSTEPVNASRDIDICSSGLRSICWKTFLLFKEKNRSTWPKILKDSRDTYTILRQHHLLYIENPDELHSASDPLDNDVNSPWNTLREIEQVRAEILQDVERCMPENQYFRKREVQRIVLDILFIFSRINSDVGYRQGMHELLAPMLWVVDQDAIDPKSVTDSKDLSVDEQLMRENLDYRFIEHDSFTLFSLLMRSAKSFYKMNEPGSGSLSNLEYSPTSSSLVFVRIQRIHDLYLACLDPELANHLTEINVLPQIFLIRWIRLLFGREFRFNEVLKLWDCLLMEDPNLELVDMVCIVMLLRIRWQLLEADSSSALTLLQNYPSLKVPHNPQKLVDDAIYLRDNMNIDGGTNIIYKYSGKLPKLVRDNKESSLEVGAKYKVERGTSPTPSPPRFLQQQAGIETLLQEAAKGVFNHGEKLGINQALREAVGEVKRNMQVLQPNSRSSGASRWSSVEKKATTSPRTAMNTINIRNLQLANMLEQATTDLRAVSASGDENVKSYIVAIELAVAKVDFVRVYLEDSTMLLQDSSLVSMPRASAPNPF